MRMSYLPFVLTVAVVVDAVGTSLYLSKEAQPRRMSYKNNIAALVIGLVSVIVVVVMFFGGNSEPKVEVENDTLHIQAMYGTDIALSDISSIALVEESMHEIAPHMKRTNGFGGFGDALKGYFTSQEQGKMLLFVQAESVPTLRIERKEEIPVYISFKDAQQTKWLYETMLSERGGE